jgi:YHS domain-containing protein
MKMAPLALLVLALAACQSSSSTNDRTSNAVSSKTTPPGSSPAAPALRAAAGGARPAAAPAAAAAAPGAGKPAAIAVGTKMKCPVTGEDFTVKPTTVQIVHGGKRYAFCCPDCQPEFEKNPAKFAQK